MQYFKILHDDVIKWKHFPRNWPFVRVIHRSPVKSQHKGQWRGALMFSMICVRINSWVNNREAGDLKRYRAHYDVTVMTNEPGACPPHPVPIPRVCWDCGPTDFIYIREESWWRHQMEIFSALLPICAGNSPVTGEYRAQRPVTRSFDVFFGLYLAKRLSKQWWGWWFETPSCPLWPA